MEIALLEYRLGPDRVLVGVAGFGLLYHGRCWHAHYFDDFSHLRRLRRERFCPGKSATAQNHDRSLAIAVKLGGIEQTICRRPSYLYERSGRLGRPGTRG